MNKEDVVHLHSRELQSRKKYNDFLKFADKWMDLENSIFNEVSLTQKNNYHMYSLIGGF